MSGDGLAGSGQGRIILKMAKTARQSVKVLHDVFTYTRKVNTSAVVVFMAAAEVVISDLRRSYFHR